jgi:scavenger receptor class B protein 1
MKDASMITRWGLNVLIRQTDSKPLVHMTAKEFMFGYESTLVTLGNNVMPSWIKFDRLGLIDRVNYPHTTHLSYQKYFSFFIPTIY